MSTRLNMGAFLENPMFLFMDDAEPILPTFRSPEYGDTGRIVELTDIGCDTEITFPVHLSRGAFGRHRGGAESLGSTRRIAKWRHGRPNDFLRRAVDNYEGRNGSYIRGKTRRDDYDDAYIDDLYYDDPYAEIPHGDPELRRDDPEEEDNYYTQFVNPQNAITRFREKRVPRYGDLEDPESPFTRSVHVPQRENTSPRWFAERNLREIRGTDIRSSERKKRTKILSRTGGSFNREAEFEETHRTMRRERDDFPKAAADPVAPPSFWNFISFEDETGCEERESTFCDPRRAKNHGGLQKMAPHRKRSYIFGSQPKRVDDSEGEEESKQASEDDSRENLSPKILMEGPRYRASKGDAVMEKPKILRLNTSSASSSRGRSTRTPIDKRISNMSSVEQSSVDMRPRSANEGKKINPPTAEKREEITTRMIVDDRRYRDKFVNKLSNNSSKKTSQSTRTFNRVSNSKSNGRIYAANERDNTCSHSGNSGNSKMDQINVSVSRSPPEEKITRNERTFALRMTGASAPRANIEEVKKFLSRLPVRTWKRLRTKEPATLRPESDPTNGDVKRKLERAESETTRSNDHPERVEDDDVREGDRATANKSDVKRSQRFGTGLLGADKPGLTSSGLKSVKGIKGSNTRRGGGHTSNGRRE